MEVRQTRQDNCEHSEMVRKSWQRLEPCPVCARGEGIQIYTGSRGSQAVRITVWQDLGPRGILYSKSWDGDYAIHFLASLWEDEFAWLDN
jgi:hypothetical protein